MSNIAISGHTTRGKEVIEILKMLGGINSEHFNGDGTTIFYFIKPDNSISAIGNGIDYRTIFHKMTLEKFLVKFPYKVGDEVVAYAEGVLAQFTIQDMRWNYELNKVEYKICSSWYDTSLIQPYKEETFLGCIEKTINECLFGREEIMEENNKKSANHIFDTEIISFDIAQRDKYELDLQGKFQVVSREGKCYVERIKPQYPKTYEECCEVLGIRSDWHLTLELDEPATHDLFVTKEFDYVAKLESLRKLFICRNAYWKIAGEKMGLNKPWEPDWSSCEDKFCITIFKNKQTFDDSQYISRILAFPTTEMRDAFYENFKKEIETCKEFL